MFSPSALTSATNNGPSLRSSPQKKPILDFGFFFVFSFSQTTFSPNSFCCFIKAAAGNELRKTKSLKPKLKIYTKQFSDFHPLLLRLSADHLVDPFRRTHVRRLQICTVHGQRNNVANCSGIANCRYYRWETFGISSFKSAIYIGRRRHRCTAAFTDKAPINGFPGWLGRRRWIKRTEKTPPPRGVIYKRRWQSLSLCAVAATAAAAAAAAAAFANRLINRRSPLDIATGALADNERLSTADHLSELKQHAM